MYVDNFLTITNPAITSNGTYISASLDFGVDRDLAEGTALKIVITRTGAFAGGNDVSVQVFTADTASVAATAGAGGGVAGTVGSGEYVLASTSALALVAATAAGLPVQLILPLPAPRASNLETPGARYKRYVYLKYVATGTHTGSNAGNLSAQIVIDAQDGVTYHADAIATLPNPV
jgi:hypothetical protein